MEVNETKQPLSLDVWPNELFTIPYSYIGPYSYDGDININNYATVQYAIVPLHSNMVKQLLTTPKRKG